MSITAMLSLAGLVFRIMQEAPHLIDEVEQFWNSVSEKEDAHPTVKAAMQAAFVRQRAGEVG